MSPNPNLQESRPAITCTQSFVKSVNLVNSDEITPENSNLEDLLQSNDLLPLNVLLEKFSELLSSYLRGEALDAAYCEYMRNQCSGWEISDSFNVIENYNGSN